MEKSEDDTAQAAREAVEAPDPTLEALRVQRDAYAVSAREAAVVYDKLRDELVVAKQRLSDQEKGLATARLDLPAATEVQQEQTTALFEANRAATGDTS
jgi:hypothetical protein